MRHEETSATSRRCSSRPRRCRSACRRRWPRCGSKGSSGGGMVTVVMDGQKNLIVDPPRPRGRQQGRHRHAPGPDRGRLQRRRGEGRRAPRREAGRPGRRGSRSRGLSDVRVRPAPQPPDRGARKIPSIGAKTAQRIAFHILGTAPGGRRAAGRGHPGASRRASSTAPSATTSPTSTPAGTARTGQRTGRMPCASSRSPTTSRRSRRPGVFHGRYHVLLGSAGPAPGDRPGRPQAREARRARWRRAGSRRSSSPPTRRPRARRRPTSWPGSSRAATSGSPGWPWACPSARTWISPTRSRSRRRWKGERNSRIRISE